MARKHIWLEGLERFAVEETEHGLLLEGRRFNHSIPDSGEAVLAREVLRLAGFKDILEKIALALGCLPTQFPDSYGHVFQRILELRESWENHEMPWHPDEARDEDGLTDSEADAQTLEGVYGPGE